MKEFFESQYIEKVSASEDEGGEGSSEDNDDEYAASDAGNKEVPVVLETPVPPLEQENSNVPSPDELNSKILPGKLWTPFLNF